MSRGVHAAAVVVGSQLATFVVKEHSLRANNPLQSEHVSEGLDAGLLHASVTQRCVALRRAADERFSKLAAVLKLHAALQSLDRWQLIRPCATKCRHSSRETISRVKIPKCDVLRSTRSAITPAPWS
jgi:hypothetical protein